MDEREFRAMWEQMHREGYFSHHVHYVDWRETLGSPPGLGSREPDPSIAQLDFSQDCVEFPGPYTIELERAVKRSEPFWLPKLLPLPSGTMLDLGCGFGRSLDWLHQRFERAIGVELSETVLDLARRRYRHVEHVEFLLGDGRSLPSSIPARSLDFIYCFNVFEHVPRSFTRSYLADFGRVLKPGGRAAFNVLSGAHETTEDGPAGAEWTIGYGAQHLEHLLQDAGLQLHRRCDFRVAGGEAFWIWAVVGPARGN